MRKYVRMQIIKHAIEYYIERPNVTEYQVKQEKEALKQVVQDIENLKIAYNIENSGYNIKHSSGIEFTVEANGQKYARKKAFSHYKKMKKDTHYSDFIENAVIEKIE